MPLEPEVPVDDQIAKRTELANMVVKRKQQRKRKHKSLPKGKASLAKLPLTEEREIQPPSHRPVSSKRHSKKLQKLSVWIVGIAALLSVPSALLVFWQYYIDVPQVISEIRAIFAVEKVGRLPDGSIGNPKSVVITLGVFIANTGKRPTGIDKITIRSLDGVGYNPQGYYDNFKLDPGDSKKINVSIEINYNDFSTPHSLTVDMILVNGQEINIDQGTLVEGIVLWESQPTDKPYSPQITSTDLWCNDKRMAKARQIVGEARYNHNFPLEVSESPELKSMTFVAYYYCTSKANHPQIKAHPTYTYIPANE